jgi:hypothetical protein
MHRTPQALIDQLAGSAALRKDPPRIVTASECLDGNSHFVFPAYKSPASGNTLQLQHEVTNRRASSRPYVPEVLPIQLPSGTENPKSTTIRTNVLRSWDAAVVALPHDPATTLSDVSNSTKDDDEFAGFQSSDEIIEKEYNISL